MRVALLSSGTGWHVQDLQRAVATRHVEFIHQDFATLQASIPSSAAGALVSGSLPPCGGGLGWGVGTLHGTSAYPPSRPSPTRGEGEKPPAAYLVRTMPAGSLEQVIFRMDVLHAAESRGIPVFNPPRALECCIDKYLTTQRLHAAGLPVPRTWCGQTADDAMIAYERLGSDVIIKPLFGSEGRGMVRVSDVETAWRVCHAVANTGGVLYLQEFIEHDGWDVRAFVLGDQVLAAMRRQSDSWRTNVAQGASTSRLGLSASEQELAIAAAKVVGCPIAGVDLLHGPDGCYVLEVNGVPGWKALSATCEVDVAGAVLDFVAARVRA